MWEQREVTERMVRVGGTWLRVTAVDAIERDKDVLKSRVHLRGGGVIAVNAERDAIANALWKTEAE